MTKHSRRKFTSEFKTKVVFEALKERNTIEELAKKYEVHPSLVNSWKREFIEAIERHGKPEIVHTDQGSQFTSEEFTGLLLGEGVQISMDGKGRAIDNIYVEVRFVRDGTKATALGNCGAAKAA